MRVQPKQYERRQGREKKKERETVANSKRIGKRRDDVFETQEIFIVNPR
jgi:hypothetical protein